MKRRPYPAPRPGGGDGPSPPDGDGAGPYGGRAVHVALGVEYQATSTQVCELYPFVAGAGAPSDRHADRTASASAGWASNSSNADGGRALAQHSGGDQKASGGGEPVAVVSTQLVEAGVDLDFPEGFRAAAPADSLQQAAVDRSGRLSCGTVTIFDPEDGNEAAGSHAQEPFHAERGGVSRLATRRGCGRRPSTSGPHPRHR